MEEGATKWCGNCARHLCDWCTVWRPCNTVALSDLNVTEFPILETFRSFQGVSVPRNKYVERIGDAKPARSGPPHDSCALNMMITAKEFYYQAGMVY